MSAVTSAAERMRGHPCFDGQAHDTVGRVHLPVAPRCNIQCAFCERRLCANIAGQHPGWAERLLSPEEALALVRRLALERQGERFVVGVAGPGDPLANEETFAVLEAVQHEFPGLTRCLSTNGLLLQESLPQLIAAGVGALTVTVNAPDVETAAEIYRWVRHGERLYRGREAAQLLVAGQFRGLRAALEAGLAVKVNTVLIPGVNDHCLGELAAKLRASGVRLMNIMPLIPAGAMADRRAPTCEELCQARLECEKAVPQFRRCEHCRADVIRFPRRRDP